MYTPKHNEEHDHARIVAFMTAYNFATLVSAKAAGIKATHLPFVVESDGETVKLFSHFAKTNDHWKDLDAETDVLVIFQEPHAYVSPTHYEKHPAVPTWNYVAVHATGRPTLFHDAADKLRLLEKSVTQFEPSHLDYFKSLPADFLKTKLAGIVAFEIQISKLESRFKLSQDRTEAEKQAIIKTFAANPDKTVSKIGEMMKDNLSR
jgi:transcriptional regulator